MIERPHPIEIAGALLFVVLLIFALAPIAERAETVFAFFDIIEGRF
jgi:hypothetical protein